MDVRSARSHALTLALMLALAAPLPGIPDSPLVVREAAAADGAWFGIDTESWFLDAGAVTFDSRRARAIAVGGTLYSIGRGGVTYQSDYDSLHTLSMPNGLALASLPTTGPNPLARAYAAAAYDSAADRVWLFGGRHQLVDHYNGTQPVYVPQVLADLSSLELGAPAPYWRAVTAANAGPARRYGHSLVADPVHHWLLVFGGRDSSLSAYADVWLLDTAQDPPVWSQVVPSGAAPAARWNHVAAFDPVSQRLYVHGGQSTGGTLTDSWVLDLSGSPQWVALTPSGAPPAHAVAAAWDSRRDRLLVYEPTPAATLYALEPGVSPAWSALDISDPLALKPVASTVRPGMAYDPGSDLLLLPYSQIIGRTFSPYVSRHHVITLDGAPAFAALAPELLSWNASRGLTTTRWQLHQGPGLLYELPHLQRQAAPQGWSDVSSPSTRDSIAGTVDYPDQNGAGASVTWRLRWRDAFAEHVSDTFRVNLPPAPIDMSSAVDSALVYGGAVRLQWTLADDSLSYLEPPLVSRWSAATGWVSLASVWPDSARRVRFADFAVATGVPYRYELRWTALSQMHSSGGLDLTVTSPIPTLAERRQPGLGTYVRWSVPGAATFTAIAQHRINLGAWVPIDTLDADGARDVVAAERRLPLETRVDYRLAWDDAGVQAYTPAERFDVPPFTADVVGIASGTHRVSITWNVWPVDSLLPLAVYREDAADVGFVSRRAVPSGNPAITYVDTTVTPGHSYTYHVAAEENLVEHSGGLLGLLVPAEPSLTALLVTPHAVAFDWLPCTAATAYQVWRSMNHGAFENIMDIAPSSTPIHFVDGFPAVAETLTYQLRWREADGLWRALRDTTVAVGSGNPQPTEASFAISSANPASDGVTLSYALPDERAAKLRVFDLTGRLKYSRTLAGAGAATWTIGRGVLEPGIYWVRFDHPALSRTVRVVVLR